MEPFSLFLFEKKHALEFPAKSYNQLDLLLAIGISRSVKPQGCLMRLLCPRESRRPRVEPWCHILLAFQIKNFSCYLPLMEDDRGNYRWQRKDGARWRKKIDHREGNSIRRAPWSPSTRTIDTLRFLFR